MNELPSRALVGRKPSRLCRQLASPRECWLLPRTGPACCLQSFNSAPLSFMDNRAALRF